MISSIPIVPAYSQVLNISLGGLAVKLSIYTIGRSTDLYIDVEVENSPIISGQIIKDRVRLVREAYLGFVGDLAFVDTIGTSDPEALKLGDRYQLVYLP